MSRVRVPISSVKTAGGYHVKERWCVNVRVCLNRKIQQQGTLLLEKKKLSFDSTFVFTATGSDTTIEQGTSCEVKLTSELNKSLEIHTLDRLSKDIQH